MSAADKFVEDMKAGRIYFVAGVAYRTTPEKYQLTTEEQRIAICKEAIAAITKLQVAA